MRLGLFAVSDASGIERNLWRANNAVDKSLAKLSSGERIHLPADDAGGLAVSMNIAAALKRLGAVQTNLMNADSFVRVQDDALKSVGDLLTRMSELKVLSADISKNPADLANYATEYWQLAAEIRQIGQRTFNGIPLFSSTDKEEFLHCQSRHDGGPTIELVLPPLKEPSLLEVFGEHVYEIVRNAIQWDAAKAQAESRGGHLATITSSEEWKEILWQLGDKVTADPLWIGLKQTGGPEPEGGWHWITNEIFAYTNWKDGEPDNDGFSGFGSAADRLSWNLIPECGRWYDETKTSTLTTGGWDGGYLLEYWSDSSKTTKVYEMVKQNLTWDEAKVAAYAGKRGSGKTDIPPELEPHLANLSSKEELDEARSQLRDAGNFPSRNNLWLGGFQPDGVSEPPPTNGWQWIADVEGGVQPPWTVPIGQDPSSGWYMGKASGNDIWGPWCINQPDNVGKETPNAWSGYISGPLGEWSDGIYDHQAQKGIVGYLLERENELSKIPLSGITQTIEWVAHYRAQCAAESMAIGIAAEAARTASINLEAAQSRIADVDVAQTMVGLTRAKILAETGAQMLVKAHDFMQVASRLIQDMSVR